MNISNLVIEVTRKCNMICDHCLRGDMENIDLNKSYIDTLLNQVDNIGNVTFTGGEPSLNVPIIEYFLEVCKDKNIDIGSFYIATNGKRINEDFVLICLKLYSYCYEKEMCQVHYSNDIYHEYENNGNPQVEILEGLSFYHTKWDKTHDYNGGRRVIGEGRGSNINYQPVLDETFPETQEDFNDRTIYLNCKGEIIIGCDYSYENQEYHKFCEVEELESIYNELPED